MVKIRGRPKKSHTPVPDEIIGRAARQLKIWGFTESQIYEQLPKPAAKILSRTDTYGLPLSRDRIKQIHKQWEKEDAEKSRKEKGYYIPFERWRFTKRSLQLRRPSNSITELIPILLSNKGVWPVDDPECLPGPVFQFSKRAERLSVLYPRINSPTKKSNRNTIIIKRK